MKWVKLTLILICAVLLLTACTSSDTVITIGGEDISHDMYRYFHMNYKKESDRYTEEQVYQKTVKALAQDVALTKLADKYNITLSDTDEAQIEKYVEAATANYGGKEEFKSALKENYLTEELFEYLYSRQILETKLRDHMYDERNNIIKSDDATFEKDLQVNFMAAKQILIRNDEGDDTEKNKTLAEDILLKLRNGADFDALIKEYSEDSSANDDYVYYFTRGQMLSAFEEAVEETEEGKLCQRVVYSEAGYHIVMRLPLDNEYTDTHYEELRRAYKARCFNEIRDEMAESFAVEKANDFDTLKFDE